MGAAIAAAVGAGWYPSFKKAAHEMAGIKKTIRPEAKNLRIYQQLFAVYKSIYPSLKKLESDSSKIILP